MKNKDELKIRFGGWNYSANADYHFIRKKLERFWLDEAEEDILPLHQESGSCDGSPFLDGVAGAEG